MQLYVGEAGLRGSFERYVKSHQLLELRARAGTLPRPAKLRSWRETAPEGFAFSVAVDLTLAGGAAELEYARKCADPLKAEWLVFRTGLDFPPSKDGRERLRAFWDQVVDAGHQLAWEPGGVWETGDAAEFAEAQGICLVVDPGRDTAPQRAAIYTRLRSLGAGGRVRALDVERAADNIAHAETAFVVVQGGPSGPVAQQLTRALMMNEPESEP